MDSNSWRAKGPSDLRKDGGIMLSGPAAPLLFAFLMAGKNSPIWSGAQLSLSADGALSCLLKWRLRSWSAFDMLSLLTLAYCFMKMLGLALMLVILWPFCGMAPFGEFSSGVPFKPWMTFHIFVHLSST